MSGRIVLVACLLVLAGCGGAPADPPAPSETVTPAPVPTTETPVPEDPTTTAPGFENESVDGGMLGAMHANTLAVPHTRTVEILVDAPNRTLLAYRANRTITGNSFRLTRTYRGPLTARYVPGAETATSARLRRYRSDDRQARQQYVDGVRRTDGNASGAPRLGLPVAIDDVGYVAALLDGATLSSRTPSGGYLLAVDGAELSAATVPGILTAPRDGVVRGRLRETGRVSRLRLEYEATVDGQPVTVSQVVRWRKPTVNGSTPVWVDD